MSRSTRNASLLLGGALSTFMVFRLSLWISPNSDFNLAGYNIHHLFTGLLLVVVGGVPLVLAAGHFRLREVCTVVFGAGLAMTLDEWVYLIATDGSNTSYLLPVSFWGAVVMIGLLCLYVIFVTKLLN